LNGGLGNDTLNGGSGNDLLDGGAGADQMIGAGGDDEYVVDAGGDQVVELANQGTDTVHSSINMILLVNLENLTLTGTLAINGTGNAAGNVLTGNGIANLLQGLAGNDTLSGGLGNDTLNGGSGDDVLDGGAGNDQLIGAGGAERFVFASGSGVDTITDFSVTLGDRIQLTADLNGSGIVSAATALAHTTDIAGNAVIDLGGGNTVTLIGVLKETLDVSDFMFV
jgi:Ca2+-binding RTX toxin-like protein